MTNSVDRFQILEANQLMFPHKCSVCGGFSDKSGNKERKFIDFGLDIEFYGKVYICTECFSSATSIVDCVPVEKYNSLEQQFKELSNVVSQLIEENGMLRSAVDTFRIISNNEPGPNIVTISAIEDEERSDKGTAEGKKGFVKQTDERGSEDLHSNVNAEPASTFSSLGLDI